MQFKWITMFDDPDEDVLLSLTVDDPHDDCSHWLGAL